MGSDFLKRTVTGRLTEFDITVPNKPGALAELAEQLAADAVNIKAISTSGSETIRLVTSDEGTTRKTLTKAKLPWTETEILQVRLLNRPGELAKIARMLSKAKINVDSVYLLCGGEEYTDLALKASDPTKAAQVLSG